MSGASADSSVVHDVQRLSTGFGVTGRTVRAVDDVSVTVRRGETIALVGESGCGKSVTAPTRPRRGY